MTNRAAIVIAAVALLFGAAGSLFGAPQAGLAALKRQYWRPAAIPYPKENPYGRAKEELGRALFFDPILSGARARRRLGHSGFRPPPTLIGHSLIVMALLGIIVDDGGKPARIRDFWLIPAAYVASLALFLATYYMVHAELFGTTVL